jgi:hypothetical protein
MAAPWFDLLVTNAEALLLLSGFGPDVQLDFPSTMP